MDKKEYVESRKGKTPAAQYLKACKRMHWEWKGVYQKARTEEALRRRSVAKNATLRAAAQVAQDGEMANEAAIMAADARIKELEAEVVEANKQADECMVQADGALFERDAAQEKLEQRERETNSAFVAALDKANTTDLRSEEVDAVVHTLKRINGKLKTALSGNTLDEDTKAVINDAWVYGEIYGCLRERRRAERHLEAALKAIRSEA